jgi:peptidyl-prolyl cis-trans isomerase SurA
MSWRLRVSLAALLLLTTSVHADEPIEGIAAIVGEDVILRSDVDSAMAPVLARIRAQQGPVTSEVERQVRDEALRSLIDDKLILRVAERNNMEASAQDIDQAIEGIANDEGVSVEEIYAAVSSQGLTREQYRSQLGAQLTKMRVVSGSVQSRVSVGEDEVRELYERRFGNVSPGVRLRVLHILLPWPQVGSAASRSQIQEMASSVRARALESGDFAGLARRVSAAPTAAQGGLTVFRQGEAPPAIEQALGALSPGEISPIVETEHGLNLFQFIDRFDPSKVALADVEGQLRYELQERKSGPELEKWLGELREMQYIEIVDLE